MYVPVAFYDLDVVATCHGLEISCARVLSYFP